MLLELNIKNFAIMEDLHVEFSKGLNIITGETGTGKSILIEALSVLLGSRINREYIRTGSKEANLEAVFYLENTEGIEDILKSYNIPLGEDRILIVTKNISMEGPSISKLNGKTVNLTMLNKVSARMVDIFGQFEHQSLLDIDNHIKIVDSFGNEEFKGLKEELEELYSSYSGYEKELRELGIDSKAKDREIDMLNFQIDEITAADLRPEDEDIEPSYRRLKNLDSVKSSLAGLVNSLDYNDLASEGVISLLNRSIIDMESVLQIDSNLESIVERLKEVLFELEDISRESKDYVYSLDLDSEAIDYLEERMDQINNLKSKYGNSIEEILNFRDQAQLRLDNLLNQDKEISRIESKILEISKAMDEISLELSRRRKEISLELESLISKELEMLNMHHVRFKVDFSRRTNIGPDGFDRLEFLISTNVGEDLKSLQKIASGGEMSRIMLAFKNILADYDRIQTLIFDEIDTGISGRTAQIVGEKIYEISEKHQVICISHLPQIAALGDSHYIINKKTLGQKTQSYIERLDYEERVVEISRLIGGADITETTKKHAIEMLELAGNLKEKL